MGNDHSSIPLHKRSKEHIADYVSSLGSKFAAYARSIDENGVDGSFLSGLSGQQDFEETLDDLGITERLHRRKLMQELSAATRTCTSYHAHKEASTTTTNEESDSDDGSFDLDSIILPSYEWVEEVRIRDIEDRPSDFPQPSELPKSNPMRDSHSLAVFNQGGRATGEQLQHLPEHFFATVDSIEGAYRPPIPEDDMERIAQVESYELRDITANSEIGQTLKGYIEFAIQLIDFDLGDITFFDHESIYSFAQVGMVDYIQKAFTPVDATKFLCKTDRAIAICNYPTFSKRTFVVHDIQKDETFKWLSDIWPFRCYAGTPLISHSGMVIAILCLHSMKPRPDFNKAREVQIEQIARMIVHAIENWSQTRRIAKTSCKPSSSALLSFPSSAPSRQPTKTCKPPEGNAVLVVTDIQDSTQLWEMLNARVMKRSLQYHDDIVRKARVAHSGYEVDTEGDSFLLAFHDAEDAFAFCLQVQEQLYNAKWDTSLSQHPATCRDEHRKLNGFRVRMGVHVGEVIKEENVVTGRIQYAAGKTLELTNAVAAMAHGGQILTTFETWNSASFVAETKLKSPQVIDLGTHVLRKGKLICEGVISKRIMQLVPASLAINYSEMNHHQLSPDVNKDTSSAVGCCHGRIFPPINSIKKLSKSFSDAPNDNGKVAIAFIGTKEIENRYRYTAEIVAGLLGKASTLLLGIEGYQCQNNMFAFPSIKTAVQFGLKFMEIIRRQPPLKEDGLTDLTPLVTFGCVYDEFVTLEPHRTTGRADYFGKVVNRAARVAYSSPSGKVCLGVTTQNAFTNTNAFQVDDTSITVHFLEVKQLKGVEMKIAIFECKRKSKKDTTILQKKVRSCFASTNKRKISELE